MKQFHIHYLMRYSNEYSEMDRFSLLLPPSILFFIYFFLPPSILNKNSCCGLLKQPVNNKVSSNMQALSPGPISSLYITCFLSKSEDNIYQIFM